MSRRRPDSHVASASATPLDAPSCPMCGGAMQPWIPDAADPQTGEHFAVVRCGECELGRTHPVPADLSPYYGDAYYGGRHGATDAWCTRRRLRWIERMAADGVPRRLLDVGCGEGSLLRAAARSGWQVAGVEREPAPAFAVGLEMHARLADVTEGEAFGCVTFWHSLEHLPDPVGEVSRAARLLAPGGVLLIAVPDAGGLQSGLFQHNWLHLDVPRHLTHFTSRSLERMVMAAGLRVERRWHQELEYDLLGWSQSALNALLPRPNLFFQQLTGREPAPPVSGTLRWANMALGAALTAAALPVVAASTLAGRGGTLVIAARRPR